MNVAFFDNNPEIVNELRTMDHSTREYRKNMQKVLLEIGGPIFLFSNLKTTDEGNQIRKKYFHQLILTGAFVISMFVWIFITFLLVGGREPEQFTGIDTAVFIGFIVIEVVSIFMALFIAFRAKRFLLLGVSYLIDNYQQAGNVASGQTLSSYKFQWSKINKMALIVPIVIMAVVYGLISLANGSLSNLIAAQPQEFSKAGLTITLTKDFHEKELVAQTATYSSAKFVITTLKEEFQIFEDYGMSTDITLNEYADAIISAYELDTTIAGSDSRPSFVYSQLINGKDISYLATVYRGSDAFWSVTFACETKYFEDSQGQFEKWADTIKVE